MDRGKSSCFISSDFFFLLLLLWLLVVDCCLLSSWCPTCLLSKQVANKSILAIPNTFSDPCFPTSKHLAWAIFLVMLLMEEILHHLGCIKPVNNGINYLSTGAGFQPSTVVILVKGLSGSKPTSAVCWDTMLSTHDPHTLWPYLPQDFRLPMKKEPSFSSSFLAFYKTQKSQNH